MNIAEELFLLLITDKGTKEIGVAAHDQAIGAGVLAELVLGEYVSLTEEKKPEIAVVAGAEVPADPVLVEAFDRLKVHAPIRVDKALNAKWFNLREEVGKALADKDIVRVDESSFLFFTSVKHPTVNEQPEQQLRQRLAAVLRGNAQADVKDAVVLSLLNSINAAHTLLKNDVRDAGGSMSRKEISERIESLQEEIPGLTESLKKAFQNIMFMLYTMPAIVTTSAAVAGTGAAL